MKYAYLPTWDIIEALYSPYHRLNHHKYLFLKKQIGTKIIMIIIIIKRRKRNFFFFFPRAKSAIYLRKPMESKRGKYKSEVNVMEKASCRKILQHCSTETVLTTFVTFLSFEFRFTGDMRKRKLLHSRVIIETPTIYIYMGDVWGSNNSQDL